jgi:diguanylate cyclase (GGDEF)-like protein
MAFRWPAMGFFMLHRVATAFHRLCSGDLTDFGAPVMPTAIAGRLRAEQIGAIVHYLPWMMLANASNALVLVAALWTSPDRFWALAWALAVIGYSALYGVRSIRRRQVRLESVSERTIRRAVRNALLLGCLWAILPLQFFEQATSGGQLIIACLCAGMLGGSAFAFASLPVAAIAFAGPLFVASSIAIARAGEQTYLLVAVLMFVYTMIILRGVFTHALRMMNQLNKQAEVEEEARKDPLTNLGNRMAFHESLERAFTQLQQTRKPFALLYLDLNDFKSVNDRFGHAAGDALLVQVGDRLRMSKGEGDLVARLGGDEFALVAPNIHRRVQAVALAERIVRALDPPFPVDGQQVSSAVSVGIAMAPENGADLGSLLKNADIALYHAKRGAGGSIQFFEPSHDAKARERRTIEHDLRSALSRNQFRLVFQPILNLTDMRIVGCEALLRWHHPVRGVLAPGQFIPIAEDTGLIHAIGEWVLLEACQTAAAWPNDIKVAVNLSPVQLRRTGIFASVVNSLSRSRLSPSRLEIEITESALIEKNNFDTLRTLRELGITIALDDFGIGYSSLIHLRNLPLNRVKIDRSFISDLVNDSHCRAIVKGVIGMARDLGMNVTAEGVETAEQLTRLREMSCTEVQGYLISKPKPTAELGETFVQDWKGSNAA